MLAVNDHLTLKALCLQTKVLIIVSEFEARKMPIFQLRSVLSVIVSSDEEKKKILEAVDAELRAANHPSEQVTSFLNDLLALPPPVSADQAPTATRRLRSPFAMSFDSNDANAGPPPPERVTTIMTQPPAPAARSEAVTKVSPAGRITPPKGNPMPRAPFGPPMPTPPPNMPRSAHDVAPPPPPPSNTRTFMRTDLTFGASKTPVAPPQRLNVLLADDDKRIRMVFRLRLEEAGFAVIEANDGNEAWEKVKSWALAAVVLDMKMPGMHGLEVLTKMADEGMTTPVVVCSAYDQLENEFVVQKYGSLRYLVKPIAPETLVTTIKELLGAKK